MMIIAVYINICQQYTHTNYPIICFTFRESPNPIGNCFGRRQQHQQTETGPEQVEQHDVALDTERIVPDQPHHTPGDRHDEQAGDDHRVRRAEGPATKPQHTQL